MTYSNEYLQALSGEGGVVGHLAKTAIHQRKKLAEMEEAALALKVKIRDAEQPFERQVRDMAVENARLRRVIAELQSR